MKTRSIVTGGAGFIGSHLAELLHRNGHAVTVVDNLATGRTKNIDHLLGGDDFEFVEADICDASRMKELFQGTDYVFHLAALADIVPSIQRPDDYHRANVDGTFSVLEAARAANVKKLVYAASSSCYGIPDAYPTPESAEIRAMYPYALTKNIGEQYVMKWHQYYKLPVVALRLFNVYGPRARTSGTYGAVFGVFLAQLINGKPFTVVGDGEQTRDFTFVTDVAAAFLAAANSDISGEIFNVGSGGTYSINKLVHLLDEDHKVEYLPKRPGEPDCTFADTARIRKSLDWKPTVPFEEGVKIMIENIEQWRDAPVWDTEKISVATKDWFQYLAD